MKDSLTVPVGVDFEIYTHISPNLELVDAKITIDHEEAPQLTLLDDGDVEGDEQTLDLLVNTIFQSYTFRVSGSEGAAQYARYQCLEVGDATLIVNAEERYPDGTERPTPKTIVIHCLGPDAGMPDGGTIDAGVMDSGIADSGATDSGITDSGPTDAGVPDAGPTDAGGGGTALCATAGCPNDRKCPETPPMVGSNCAPFASPCCYCTDGDLVNAQCYRCTEFDPYSVEAVDCSP